MSKHLGFYTKQGLHGVALILLVTLVVLASRMPHARQGQALGLSTSVWIWLCVATAVTHQIYVWLCWRLELLGQRFSKAMGVHAFRLFAIGFAVLGGARFVLPWGLAYANRAVLPWSLQLSQGVALLLLLPALYLLYSVIRYFGFARAVGKDHFDARYRHLPWVTEGIFKYSRNGMYVFGFLFFWVPALWFGSVSALVIAAFNYLYIWVHFYCTEQPDMHHLYG